MDVIQAVMPVDFPTKLLDFFSGGDAHRGRGAAAAVERMVSTSAHRSGSVEGQTIARRTVLMKRKRPASARRAAIPNVFSRQIVTRSAPRRRSPEVRCPQPAEPGLLRPAEGRERLPGRFP